MDISITLSDISVPKLICPVIGPLLYNANQDEDLLYFCLSFILHFLCVNTMNNDDLSTLQSLQHRKRVLQITQKINAIGYEVYSFKGSELNSAVKKK